MESAVAEGGRSLTRVGVRLQSVIVRKVLLGPSLDGLGVRWKGQYILVVVVGSPKLEIRELLVYMHRIWQMFIKGEKIEIHKKRK